MRNFGMVSRARYSYGSTSLHQRAELRRPAPVHDSVLDIVLDGGRPEAVGAPVMDERRLDVQHVDDERRDGHDAPIDGRGRPRRPAALRRAGHDKARHLDAAAGRGHECRHGIHRAHRALGHRQLGGPAIVAGAQKFVPGVRDEVVFDARLLRRIVAEHDGLIRHHPKLSHDGVRRPRNPHEIGRRFRGTRTRARAPVMKSSAVSLVTTGGRITVSQ